jgi:hypothetical protein
MSQISASAKAVPNVTFPPEVRVLGKNVKLAGVWAPSCHL